MSIFKQKINSIRRFKHNIRNYKSVIFFMLLHRYPINIIYINGSSVKAYNRGFVHISSTGLVYEYEPKEDKLMVKYNDRELIFYGSFYNNDFADTFGSQTYKSLDVEGNLVIDVGANIGDSSIYFALKKASKIIAIEPTPNAYKYLIKNIKANNMDTIIEPMNVAISNKNNKIKIENNEKDVTGIKAKDEGSGISVQAITMGKLFNSFGALNEKKISF